MNSPDFPSNEYRFIEKLKKYCNYSPDNRYRIGVGDDAAVRACEKDEQLILTGDILIENVHFSTAYMSFEEVGFKALVASISDCAAMGAIPDSALIQIGFPEGSKKIEEDFSMLYSGFNKACKQWDLPIIGGDLSKAPCWIVAVSMTGRIRPQARVLMRTGAIISDNIWVSGVPGKSAAGLAVLKEWGRDNFPEEFSALVDAHIAPQARVSLGQKLAEDEHVHAVIDLSDGIAKECYTLCYENRVGMALNPPKECMIPALVKLAGIQGKPRHEWFLYGGEDYELLFTASSGFDPYRYEGVELNKIGSVTDSPNTITINNPDGRNIDVMKKGWDHLQQ